MIQVGNDGLSNHKHIASTSLSFIHRKVIYFVYCLRGACGLRKQHGLSKHKHFASTSNSFIHMVPAFLCKTSDIVSLAPLRMRTQHNWAVCIHMA